MDYGFFDNSHKLRPTEQPGVPREATTGRLGVSCEGVSY